ncbi:MAG TPA: hypothetical protein VFU21_01090 [Kofleriaceae bacterium]|nr:hypothetical protein [Kofleriaceae bacterium]
MVWLACVQPAALDSARSLPRGEKVALAAASADVQGRARHLYAEPYSEEWVTPPPDEPKSWPNVRVTPKLVYAFRLGLGAGLQLDLFGFNFLGAGLGLKWQLVGGAEGPVAIALAGRATGIIFGEGAEEDDASISELAAQGLMLVSVHPRPWLDLYAAPQLLAERLSHTKSQAGIEANTTVTASGVGAGAGAIAWVTGTVGLCADVTLVRFTAEEERRSWLTTATVGWLQRM